MVQNPFKHLIKEIPGHGKYYSLPDLDDPRYYELPYSIRVLLESAVRNCDNFEVFESNVEDILNWKTKCLESTEIPFKPSRVLLQDFTGVPAEVDLATMRDAVCRFNGNPDIINPLVPVDLVIDHSVQVDVSRIPESYKKNQDIEFERNKERFAFLKWAANAFSNMLIVPPGSGIVHQVNLEYLARVIFSENGMLYPDSLVGTDSHTTMIDGLGILAWGVGGIEAEAVMLGQPITMTLPEVIGFELKGKIPVHATATDLVLTVTKLLRQRGVVGKFVEFFGEGCKSLSVADRATISNMSPEFGATMGFFPIDDETLLYLRQTGRDPKLVERVEKYAKAQKLFRLNNEDDKKIKYTGDIIQLDLSTLEQSVAGPKRPHDHVPLSIMYEDFRKCLTNPTGFKGFGLSKEEAELKVNFEYKGKTYTFEQGTVVIAAITSCTNTSNPSVMIGAGLIAKKASELGLTVQPFIKTSLSPGSKTVIKYLESSGLISYLEKLGFYTAGFGCQTCIGNSGELDPEVNEVISKYNFVATSVLSGNRNFEGRVHPLTRANYLMSPMLVVIYALAGTVNFDIKHKPIGYSKDGSPVYLQDLWPDRELIDKVVFESVHTSAFKEIYANIQNSGSDMWKQLKTPQTKLYQWDKTSSYIHKAPFFDKMQLTLDPPVDIEEAYCLLLLGDSITTDHISPAGNIAVGSPAAQYLDEHVPGIRDYNTYGSRRGHDEVMVRGTFANTRLINKMSKKSGPYTLFVPTKKLMFIYDAAMRYKEENKTLIVIAGKEYGSGSSRDWAAKGPLLLGIKAILAESYERIHRSNLIGMGIIPLQFKQGENAETFKLTGMETFDIPLTIIKKQQEVLTITVHRENKETFTIEVICRLDTVVELEYYKNGGILHYVLRKILKNSK